MSYPLSDEDLAATIRAAMTVPVATICRDPRRVGHGSGCTCGLAEMPQVTRKEGVRLGASVSAGDALVRDILEALCRRDGLSLESGVLPGEPARNYELALRLGIGSVFGVV